jgi:hypothetical protein
MDTRIQADKSSVTVSEFDDGVWIAIHHHCAYASIGLTKEQALQLRDGINKFLEMTNVAQ